MKEANDAYSLTIAILIGVVALWWFLSTWFHVVRTSRNTVRMVELLELERKARMAASGQVEKQPAPSNLPGV